MVASFLEDGEFARLAYEWVSTAILPIYTASIRAATAAGDIPAESAIPPANGFWFAHHLAQMLALVCLPGHSTVPHGSPSDELVRQGRRFILRGLGLADARIDALEDELRGRRTPECAAPEFHATAAS
jgi:hypothetical protein